MLQIYIYITYYSTILLFLISRFLIKFVQNFLIDVMKDEEFDTFYKKSEKLKAKLETMENELKDLLNHIEPFQQFHRPTITMSNLRGRYYHCSAPIKLDGKLKRHTCHLGAIDQLSEMDEKELKKMAERKMKQLLKTKYPQMFE